MMWRIAWRSLLTRPVRALVLSCGFGFGIAVMAMLLGVGQVILEQAHTPALQGGGDLLVTSVIGPVESARFVTATALRSTDVGPRIAAISPNTTARVWLLSDHGPIAVEATGGIPSLERAMGDRAASATGWRDAPGDERWLNPDATDVLRSMDRFHSFDASSRWAASWSEWLYFNGRRSDGRTRVYVTFSTGGFVAAGKRACGVRIQVEHDAASRTVAAGATIDAATLLARAPDLDCAANHVRLADGAYRVTFKVDDVSGELVLEAPAGRSMPPSTIHGADGWLSGYTVPVLSGGLTGSIRMGSQSIALDHATGYHDHNWGFWEGVRWQWGQVAHDDTSIVYGRVLPPADIADPDRIPGFLAVLGASGPTAFSTQVSIDESTDGRHIDVRTRGGAALRLTFDAADTERTSFARSRSAAGDGLDLLQMGGSYRVKGRVAGKPVDFSARGSAETFRRADGRHAVK